MRTDGFRILVLNEEPQIIGLCGRILSIALFGL